MQPQRYNIRFLLLPSLLRRRDKNASYPTRLNAVLVLMVQLSPLSFVLYFIGISSCGLEFPDYHCNVFVWFGGEMLRHLLKLFNEDRFFLLSKLFNTIISEIGIYCGTFYLFLISIMY